MLVGDLKPSAPYSEQLHQQGLRLHTHWAMAAAALHRAYSEDLQECPQQGPPV